MKKVTRHGVFETNSSSTHSISIGSNKPEYPNFKGEEITLEQGEFGWEIRRFHSFSKRLQYAYTYAKNYRKEGVELIKKLLFEHCNCSAINESDFEGYIDHQSDYVCSEAFVSEDTLHNFLFSNDSYFTTDNDNHWWKNKQE